MLCFVTAVLIFFLPNAQCKPCCCPYNDLNCHQITENGINLTTFKNVTTENEDNTIHTTYEESTNSTITSDDRIFETITNISVVVDSTSSKKDSTNSVEVVLSISPSVVEISSSSKFSVVVKSVDSFNRKTIPTLNGTTSTELITTTLLDEEENKTTTELSTTTENCDEEDVTTLGEITSATLTESATTPRDFFLDKTESTTEIFNQEMITTLNGTTSELIKYEEENKTTTTEESTTKGKFEVVSSTHKVEDNAGVALGAGVAGVAAAAGAAGVPGAAGAAGAAGVPVAAGAAGAMVFGGFGSLIPRGSGGSGNEAPGNEDTERETPRTSTTKQQTTTTEATTTTEDPCRNKPPYDARPANKLCNSGRGELIHIGSTCPWTPLIFVCFNPTTYRTYWTKHFLNHTGVFPTYRREPSWSKKFFHGINPEKLYLNLPISIDRGHLTPRADFDTALGRNMTFYYINAAPQSTFLNKRNWRSVENHVRALANSLSRKVKVVTGTGGAIYRINFNVSYDYPTYFFKVVVFLSEDVGSMMQVTRRIYIGYNDFELASSCSKNLCSTILPNRVGKWDDKDSGLIYNCEYNEETRERLGLTREDVDYFEDLS